NTDNKGFVVYNDFDGNLKKLIKSLIIKPKTIPYSKNKKMLSKLKKILKVPGNHNLYNALAAYNVGKILKITDKKILNGLSKYQGSWRRMEYRGIIKLSPKKTPIMVYDDYGHHPTEIAATLSAFRQKWPKNRLICVFQPHQISRLKSHFSGFKKVLKAADKALILPAYKVAGRDIKMASKYSAETLAKGIGGVYIKDPTDFKNLLRKVVYDYPPSSKIILVMMGAGNIIDYSDKLIHSKL
ncbi:hypothetical protein GW950_01660, partial [Candidatus Wolfebacteria bacterium]|nr:hypothetical protein [Candidatus Wolfebacteria bacterium]